MQGANPCPHNMNTYDIFKGEDLEIALIVTDVKENILIGKEKTVVLIY